MEAACDDVNFPCSMVDGVPKLRTDDKQGYLQCTNPGSTCP